MQGIVCQGLYHVLSCAIMCYHVLSCAVKVSIMYCHVLSCAIMCYHVLSCAIMCCQGLYHVLSCAIMCYHVLSCAIMCYHVLSRSLSCTVMCYHVLSCAIMCYHILAGVGGNLVAVQASRISTSLHSTNLKLGELPTSGKFTYNGFLGGLKCSELRNLGCCPKDVDAQATHLICLRICNLYVNTHVHTNIFVLMYSIACQLCP